MLVLKFFLNKRFIHISVSLVPRPSPRGWGLGTRLHICGRHWHFIVQSYISSVEAFVKQKNKQPNFFFKELVKVIF